MKGGKANCKMTVQVMKRQRPDIGGREGDRPALGSEIGRVQEDKPPPRDAKVPYAAIDPAHAVRAAGCNRTDRRGENPPTNRVVCAFQIFRQRPRALRRDEAQLPTLPLHACLPRRAEAASNDARKQSPQLRVARKKYLRVVAIGLRGHLEHRQSTFHCVDHTMHAAPHFPHLERRQIARADEYTLR